MIISVRWLVSLLDGADLRTEQVEDALTRAGFPIESRQDLPDGDAVLDVEITSNRGDCLCHAGLAREVAAVLGLGLKIPAGAAPGAGDAGGAKLENTVPNECPRFTLRVIEGVKVGPSPAWMRERLERVGVKSINNLVDASNYVLMELGQPTHMFDAAKLRGGRLVVRYVSKGERVVGLDDKQHELAPDDVVIADGERVVSIAGVIGGRETGVTESTTTVWLEAATWSPASVRRTSRRLRIVTDSGKRYERIVDARAVDAPADRLAALVVEVAGGRVLPGVVEAGQAPEPQTKVRLRADRCRSLIGVDIPTQTMRTHLAALDIASEHDAGADTLDCAIPANRPDLSREVDLIEEVARIHGLDAVPVLDTLSVTVKPTQADRLAVRELSGALTGLGFYETVTFSFVTKDEAAMFMPKGLRPLAVDEERRRGAPWLRPSVIPSLLRCRKQNKDAGVERVGGVRLFEQAAVYAQDGRGATVENRNLALLVDASDEQAGVRALRGAIDAVVRALAGVRARVEVVPSEAWCAALRGDAHAQVKINGAHAGYMALVSPAALAAYDLDTPAAASELSLDALLALYPPAATVEALPAFPAIERDLSVLVGEEVAWASVEQAVMEAQPALMTGVFFVGAYRGKQAGAGKKSVTLRMRFVDPARTLRHEEIDPQVEGVVAALRQRLGAEMRGEGGANR